jgi:hypothetical protein
MRTLAILGIAFISSYHAAESSMVQLRSVGGTGGTWKEHQINNGLPPRQGHSTHVYKESKLLNVFGCYLNVECFNDVSLIDIE